MKERSLAERIVAILGVLAGTIVWVVRLLFSTLQGVLKNLTGSGQGTTQASESESTTGVASNVTQMASAVRDKGEPILDEAKQRVGGLTHSDQEEDSGSTEDRGGDQGGVLQPSPDEAPAPEIVSGQHEDIGGIPETPSTDEPSAASADMDRPREEPRFDAETGAQPSHGIPNLEEPGGDAPDVYGSEAGALLESDEPVSDYAGYAKSESDVGIDRSGQPSGLADSPDRDLPAGVYRFGSSQIVGAGSAENQDLVDEIEENHIPAAGRGWQELADPLAGDPLYGDVESSGAGGEVDLRNDEADEETGSGMHVISSPNEPFLEDEPTMEDLGLSGVLQEAEIEPGLSDDAFIDDITNLESSAIDEDMLAADSTGRPIGADPASGDLGPASSYDDTERDVLESREPGEVVGAYGGSGVDEFADSSIVEDLMGSTGDAEAMASMEPDQDESGETSGTTSGQQFDGDANADSAATQSAAWASSAGVVDTDLTMPESAEDLQTGSSLSRSEAEGITDADDAPGAPGSRSELQDEFMVDGSESEAVKAPMYSEPQDAALRDVAAEMAEDIETDDFNEPVEEERGVDSRVQARDVTRGNAGGGQTAPEGSVRGDGTPNCPVEYPIKGNAKSRIYHRPSDPSYDNTIPEFCFATEADAQAAGFRARKL